MFVVFEGVDDAGKTSAANALCSMLAERAVDFLVVNKLNHSLRDPVLSEAVDYAGRIVRHCSMRSVPRVPLTVATADALQCMLLYEGSVRPALERGQLVVADAWSYKQIVKNALELNISAADETYLEWIAVLFGPSLREHVCVFFDVPIEVATVRKGGGMMTATELRPGADKAAADAEYQRILREHLRKLAEFLGWTVLPIRAGATPEDAAAIAFDVVARNPRFPA
jgi:thymidylate kinase